MTAMPRRRALSGMQSKLHNLEYREAGWQNLDPFIQTAVSALRTPSGRRLGEAAMLVSAPDPLAPQHDRNRTKPGRVVDPMQTTTVPDRLGPAGAAERLDRVSLHGHSHQGRSAGSGRWVGPFDVQDVQAGNAEQLIGPGTPRSARTTPTVIHAGVFW